MNSNIQIGAAVGFEGMVVGCSDGMLDGCSDGCLLGCDVGSLDGRLLGCLDGCRDGWLLGCVEGIAVEPINPNRIRISSHEVHVEIAEAAFNTSGHRIVANAIVFFIRNSNVQRIGRKIQ